MENNRAFRYNYSAATNDEVLEIRKRYMPREESKLDELKRLDHSVQTAGTAESLAFGTVSCLVFGVGMCMGLDVLAGGMSAAIPVGLVGVVGMMAAYPISRSCKEKMKAKYGPRILELANELSGEAFGSNQPSEIKYNTQAIDGTNVSIKPHNT